MSDKDFSKLSKEELILELHKLQNKVINLRDENETLKRYIFAKKSEKRTPEDKKQGVLFDEAEVISEESEPEQTSESAVKKDKNKGGRKPLPADLKRNFKKVDVTQDKKMCPCCQKERPLIGYKTTEELNFIPAKINVTQYQLLQYGPCSCSEFELREDLPEMIEAKGSKRFMPGSIASPSLVSHIITNKFCDSLPFYRQEKIFKRLGVNISRQNMSNWCISASGKCDEILKYMRGKIVSGKLINMDETTLQVLKEKDRTAANKSYMWVMVGGDEEKKLVLFNYSPTRKQEIPVKLLEGFSGTLQTDGYAAYNKVVKDNKLNHVGCLAHARRKFFKIAEKQKKKGRAHKGVAFYSELYRIEKTLRGLKLPPEEFLKVRRKQSIPVWKDLKKWLMKVKVQTFGSDSELEKAINYSLNQYKHLVRYLKFPDIKLDNNIVENAIRPFVIGRKNWLFNNTPTGAHSSAALYSLVETAKANGVEPDRYLNFIFSKIPELPPKADMESLMPWNMAENL